jgi:hypothetical protein
MPMPAPRLQMSPAAVDLGLGGGGTLEQQLNEEEQRRKKKLLQMSNVMSPASQALFPGMMGGLSG